MKINNPSHKTVENTHPLWRLAFRAGFLGAGIFAVASMVRWLLWMEAPNNWSTSITPHWWHGHEMIFGFAMPIVAGFLLTAVATWTGTSGTRGLRLKILFSAWLIARIVLWLTPSWIIVAWAAEMVFLTLTAYEMGLRVIPASQWRNVIFIPLIALLALLAILNTLSYLSRNDALVSSQLHYGALWMIAVIITIIGGRIIPLFTENKLGISLPKGPVWLDNIVIGATVIIGLIAAGTSANYSVEVRVLAFAVATLHIIRLVRWQGWHTRSVPLLWSMHLSYLCIPLTLLTIALFGDAAHATKNAIHLVAIGSVGGMILAMMSRVSLGHTGRPLVVPHYLAWAFAAIILAALIRSILPLVEPSLGQWAWRVAAALWVLAFSAFLWRNTTILSKPRIDGKPG